VCTASRTSLYISAVRGSKSTIYGSKKGEKFSAQLTQKCKKSREIVPRWRVDLHHDALFPDLCESLIDGERLD
jgi:hypothetical protein